MSDYILIDGDTVNFNTAFGLATVVVQPGTLSGSGKSSLNGKAICIEGDEANVSVAGCSYVTSTHSIAGSGTLKIDALSSDQVATKTQSAGQPVLLKGSLFTAKFEVQTPAQQPPPGAGSPTPDATLSYPGNGTFTTNNTQWTGT